MIFSIQIHKLSVYCNTTSNTVIAHYIHKVFFKIPVVVTLIYIHIYRCIYPILEHIHTYHTLIHQHTIHYTIYSIFNILLFQQQ